MMPRPRTWLCPATWTALPTCLAAISSGPSPGSWRWTRGSGVAGVPSRVRRIGRGCRRPWPTTRSPFQWRAAAAIADGATWILRRRLRSTGGSSSAAGRHCPSDATAAAGGRGTRNDDDLLQWQRVGAARPRRRPRARACSTWRARRRQEKLTRDSDERCTGVDDACFFGALWWRRRKRDTEVIIYDCANGRRRWTYK